MTWKRKNIYPQLQENYWIGQYWSAISFEDSNCLKAIKFSSCLDYHPEYYPFGVIKHHSIRTGIFQCLYQFACCSLKNVSLTTFLQNSKMNLLPFSAEMTSNYNKLLVLSHKLWILGTLFTNYLLSQYYFLYINLLFTILNTMLWPDNSLFSFFNIICIICKHTYWHLHHIQLHMYSFSVIVNWVAHLVKCCIDIGLELFSDFFFFFFLFFFFMAVNVSEPFALIIQSKHWLIQE